MPESDYEREHRERQEAYEAGRRTAVTESRLNAHSQQLKALNGNIRGVANQLQGMRGDIQKLEDSHATLESAIATREAVATAIKNQLERANERQVSTRAFVLGVLTVSVMLLGVILTQIHFG